MTDKHFYRVVFAVMSLNNQEEGVSWRVITGSTAKECFAHLLADYEFPEEFRLEAEVKRFVVVKPQQGE